MSRGMWLVEARNVNDALEQGIKLLKLAGVQEDSRNGPVIVMPGPVVTHYTCPWERVLFSGARDANPFFHLYESIWMLAGMNDVKSVAKYAKNMLNYSDDGEVIHGAYGFRWREWFGFDQLEELIKHLKEQPNSRRAVLTMWSPSGDLVASEGVGGIGMKDVPCNTQAYFRRRGTEGGYVLDMTIMCRSNDMVWGAYGANAVHFSVLHEYMAAAVGIKQGHMYQWSNDFHIYKSLPQFAALWDIKPAGDPYSFHETIPLVSEGETPNLFLADCERCVHTPAMRYETRFFNLVVWPMLAAHAAWRAGEKWRHFISDMPACDWKIAAWDWLKRRELHKGEA